MSGSTTIPAFLTNGVETLTNRVYDNIQATIPGVQLPVLQMELWNTIQEFCRLSSYFRQQVYWTLEPGVATIDFNPFSSDFSVYEILAVTGLINYQVLAPSTLVNTGSTANQLNGWVWLALKPTAFGNLPPILFDLWFEAILNGTLARLFGQPNKPYSNPQEAMVRMRMFRAEVRRAKDQAERFNSPRQAPWRFPYFAWGRRKN